MKLVRDKIPELSKDKALQFWSASDTAYSWLLERKIFEEAVEITTADGPGVVSEIADLIEVLRAIAKFHGISWAEVERYRKMKLDSRGGFEKRMVMTAKGMNPNG
jgi:predicted house-cleaning noncanonical NTP pyrophosphatase (MazG superfamily)